MTIKTILVPVSDSRSGKPALQAALAVARMVGAHLEALHVRPDPRTAMLEYAGEPVSGTMVEQFMRTAEERAAQDAQAARRVFDDICDKEGIALAERPPAPNGVSANWREEVGYEDRWLQALGRICDLVVLARAVSDIDIAGRLSLEAGLVETGRPVLIVPHKEAAKIGSAVAIAWKNSAESARAVQAALPFLAAAQKVVILSATEEATDQDPEGLQTYLAWHGIRASVEKLKPRGDIGPALLAAAEKAGSDLLVMGAYGHSRVRQMILGGVTRHVLGHAAIPVLMAH